MTQKFNPVLGGLGQNNDGVTAGCGWLRLVTARKNKNGRLKADANVQFGFWRVVRKARPRIRPLTPNNA
jgi:hypothetical protein